MAKYTFNVPGFFSEPAASMKDAPCGGLKDAPCAPPSAKVTLFGGYQFVQQSNPGEPQCILQRGQHDRRLSVRLDRHSAFDSDRDRQTAWAGVRYEDGPWSLTGAYYFFSQNSYLSDGNAGGFANETCAGQRNAALTSRTFVGHRVGSNCSGDFNQGSFLIDYTFNKHLDVYAGVSFTELNGGLGSGFLQNNDTAFATGVRIKW